jgi:flavin-dependent dehydrogenase
MSLNFGSHQKTASLPDTAWGLSRFAFDKLLADRAIELGAEWLRETASSATIVACGRRAVGVRGNRIFGFKAHFEGPRNDAVELYFFDGCYVGVSPIEGGRTNVCGLGPEEFLRARGFDYDSVMMADIALRRRLAPLRRTIDWLSAGPLEFRQAFAASGSKYPAGDALSFVDPFTGSGLVAAVKTGIIAGISASRGLSLSHYLLECQSILGKPFQVAAILRGLAGSGWAMRLVRLAPARALFALTRPRKMKSR